MCGVFNLKRGYSNVRLKKDNSTLFQRLQSISLCIGERLNAFHSVQKGSQTIDH